MQLSGSILLVWSGLRLIIADDIPESRNDANTCTMAAEEKDLGKITPKVMIVNMVCILRPDYKA